MKTLDYSMFDEKVLRQTLQETVLALGALDVLEATQKDTGVELHALEPYFVSLFSELLERNTLFGEDHGSTYDSVRRELLEVATDLTEYLQVYITALNMRIEQTSREYGL